MEVYLSVLGDCEGKVNQCLSSQHDCISINGPSIAGGSVSDMTYQKPALSRQGQGNVTLCSLHIHRFRMKQWAHDDQSVPSIAGPGAQRSSLTH